MGARPDAVIVGLDAGPDSARALEWAGAEAVRRGLPLHLMHVLVRELSELEPTPEMERDLRERAEALLSDARDHVKRNFAVAVSAEVVDAPVVSALVDATRTAALVVLGARGHGPVHGLLLGSVTRHVSQHAHCPVVVVREPADPRQKRVLVGVDGSSNSQDALGFAMEHAARGSAPVVAVYGWHERDYGASSMSTWTRSAERIAAEERVLGEILAPWKAKYPAVDLSGEAIPVHPARLLAEGSEHASLVVVGSRGRGEFTGMLLGSVSQEVLQHARCPVAVVHRRAEVRESGASASSRGAVVP
jgi:nucleotide-binding universal stress UspA family protein